MVRRTKKGRYRIRTVKRVGCKEKIKGVSCLFMMVWHSSRWSNNLFRLVRDGKGYFDVGRVSL